MIISHLDRGIISVFETILEKSVDLLHAEKSELLRANAGKNLEENVLQALRDSSRDTEFNDTFEIISGQRFPDIVSGTFGVEVKSTIQDTWKSTGNSVLETSRVKDVSKIYMMFGKLVNPIRFKWRPYEECLSDVVVTHSPRYLIDMELPPKGTIFDKIGTPYDQLRENDPIKHIVDYYKNTLNKETWWTGKKESNASFALEFWNEYKSQNDARKHGLALFPEIFNSDYNRFTLWMLKENSVVVPNVRDVFSAGGKYKYKGYNLPRVFFFLEKFNREIISIIETTDTEWLSEVWDRRVTTRNKLSTYQELVAQQGSRNIQRTLKVTDKECLRIVQELMKI